MTDEEVRVAALIKNAFRDVTLGNGVGLLQGQGIDDYADKRTLAEFRSRDEKEDWSQIPVEALTRCHSSLSFFDAEGMRFHLPAFLIADLEGTLGQEVTGHLTYLAHGLESRFNLLSSAQRAAVRELLLLRHAETIFEFERRDIEKALEAYWLP